ncbi:diguanylate cyclase [uncultured Clostridium sp.]|uniref:diguanylate cyclase n=1 Tax=uncultured Clostridium sp. TaxID=59620 RepID=UPI0025D28A40|nr:diguanylate cyclase [uncultured Clostridium sp.]
MQKKKLRISVSITALLIFLAFFLYMVTFRTINQVFFDASVDQTMEAMEVIRELGIYLVEDHLDDLETGLEDTASEYSGRLTAGTRTEQAAVLKELPLLPDGTGYWLASPDGTAVDSDGNVLNWNTQLDLDAAFANGTTAVIAPNFDGEGNYVFSIAAPLREHGRVKALLVARLDGFCISRWLEDIQFRIGEGVAYIVDSSGRNIAASREENYDWIMSSYNSQALAGTNEESKTVADLERQALEGKSGRGSYLWDGSRNYLVYAPIQETGWGFYVGFYGDLIRNYINNSARKSLMSSLPFFVAILSFFIILVVYANYNLKKEKRYVKELLLQKQEIQKQSEDLIVNEERFRVAMAQTNNTVFEYDLQTGDITNFYSTRVTHSSDSPEDLKKRIILNGTIDDESLLLLQHMLSDTHHGIFNNECVIKVFCSNHSVAWYKVSISPLSGQQTRVIGLMEDITKEKLAELDPLTGLLNKKVIMEQILACLKRSKASVLYAFLMFDIDNFKRINDVYGHPAGDRVIIQTGAMLKTVFPSRALIGRIGGDEFCVFCYEFATAAELKDILDSIYRRPIVLEDNITVTYSCGAVINSGGEPESFEDLYKRADEALYKAKQQGKNRYFMI